MPKNQIPVKPNSELIIEKAEGDLNLRGWSQQEIQILGSSAGEPAKDKDRKLRLSFASDTSLKIPYDLPVTIEKASGDLVIQDHHQSLSISNAVGDLVLENVHQPVIKQVNGNLTVSRVDGDLMVELIQGDLHAEQISGQAAVKCAGDLILDQVGQGIDATAEGDLFASFSPLPWQFYSLKAEGNLSITLPPDSDIKADLSSGSREIHVHLDGKKEKIEAAQHQVKTRADGAAIKISAGGSIKVSDTTRGRNFPDSLDLNNLDQVIKDFSQKTVQQIEAQLFALDQELQETLGNLSSSLEAYGLNEENLTRVKEEIREAGTLAADKAKATAQQAEQKLQKNIRRAQMKAREFQQKKQDFNLEEFIFGSSRKANQNQEERLMILQMLQDQKISAAEAAGLISALESEDPS